MINVTLATYRQWHPDSTCECIEEYGALVWSISRRLSRTPADAEDATQEIFLALWTHGSRFYPAKGSEKVFIAMIARRCSHQFNGRRALAMAFASLRREHQEVLKLSLLDGFSQSAIATRLGLPLGAVRSPERSPTRRRLAALIEIGPLPHSVQHPLSPVDLVRSENQFWAEAGRENIVPLMGTHHR